MIRDATVRDFPRILALNGTEVHATSKMDLARLNFLDQLTRSTGYHRVAIVDDQVAAFMFAMRAGVQYINPNFSWFSERFDNFIYIDRIVVDARWAGRKIGSALYRDLFDFARTAAISHVVCEYNVVPPNPVSQAFHAKWGFREMDTQWLDDGAKRVSLQVAQI